jgi:hypothetical protein
MHFVCEISQLRIIYYVIISVDIIVDIVYCSV